MQMNAASATSDFVEIGRISGWNAAIDVLIGMAQQDNGAKIATVRVTPAGVISVYTATGSTGGFYRFMAAVPEA